MKLSRPIHRLKRQAKRLARDEKIPLHAALDRAARQEGFHAWSHLASAAERLCADGVFQRLTPGDLVLLAARPGQGKTLLGLRLALAATGAGRSSAVFTLEYSQSDLVDRLRTLGMDPDSPRGLLTLDSSDGICADHIIQRSRDAPPGTLIVVDYLQLLDQRRDMPPVAEQVRALRTFAKERGLVVVFISQIDRSYDPAKKPVPDLRDVRMPNPLDLGLFDKACFLNAGEIRFQQVG